MAGISGSTTTIMGHEHLRTLLVADTDVCLHSQAFFLMPALKHQIIYYGLVEADFFLPSMCTYSFKIF